MKAKLIVNPVSGTDAAPDLLTAINRQLRERVGSLDIVITTAEGDATQAARDAVRDGYDHLFVGGGDGTLNEVLNGVADVEHGLSQVTFGVIPLGTGNDLATALGLPADVPDAIEMLLRGDAAAVDIGRMNDQYFVNVSAGGFIAEVSDAVNPQLKTVAGKLAYLIGGAQVVLTYEPVRAQLVHVKSPTTPPGAGAPVQAPPPSTILLHAFAVCNSRLVGGGRLIAPHATIDDGRIDVCLIEAMPTVDFLALLKRVSGGEHVDDARVIYFQAEGMELAFDRVIKVNTDGQVLETNRCRYDVLPRAARFLRGPASDIFQRRSGSQGSARRAFDGQ
jgi:diacylglycerol kinase (ATP)